MKKDKISRGYRWALMVMAIAPVVAMAIYIVSRVAGGGGERINQAGKGLLEKTGLILPTPTPVPMPWLSTKGNKIVDDRGVEIVLRGANLSSLYWGFEDWHPLAIENLAREWGANVTRIRVHEDRFLASPKAWFKKIEKEVINPAKKEGIYVIIHPWIGDNQPLPDARTAEMWRMIALRYKDDSTVLYDLLAEPREVSWLQTRQAYADLIKAVREVNSKSLIFVSGLSWGRRINEYADDPMPFSNIVYRSNPYNHADQFEDLFGKTALTHPVFLGEFGPSPDMDLADVEALLGYADRLGVGWTAWAFQSVGCPCLLAEYAGFVRNEYGEMVYLALKKTGIVAE